MTIQELFDAVDVQGSKDNPFESEKEKQLIDIVDRLLASESASSLYDLIDYERRRAFAVGYRTAISLIFAGVTVE